MKIEIAINKASKELKKNNIKSALLDSELLLSKVINKDREFIILNSEKNINEKDYCYFKKLIYERSNGKPIAYITGKKSFWKYEFDVDDNVLIPRPDTEIIVDQVLNIYKKKNYQHDLFFALSHGVHRGTLKIGKKDDREIFIQKLIKINEEAKFNLFGISNKQPIWAENFKDDPRISILHLVIGVNFLYLFFSTLYPKDCSKICCTSDNFKANQYAH